MTEITYSDGKWPEVVIVLLTWAGPPSLSIAGDRFTYAKRTIGELKTHFKYPNYSWHIADDGSPKEYQDKVLALLAGEKYTFTDTKRGWDVNNNINTGMRTAFSRADIVAVWPDDRFLVYDLDVCSCVRLLMSYGDIGHIRINRREPNLNATVIQRVGKNWHLLDKSSCCGHVINIGPYIEHKRYVEQYGYLPTGVWPPSRAEDSLNIQFCENQGPGAVMPSEFWDKEIIPWGGKSTWERIGGGIHPDAAPPIRASLPIIEERPHPGKQRVALYIDPARKILRHPARIHSLREGHLTFPINVEFDLSDRCNLRCTYCAFAHMRRNCDMSLELAVSIVSQLAHNRVKALTLTGGGEPTVNPDFEKIVLAMSKYYLSLGMYTNGTNYYPDAFSEMEWIYVSLDAANESDFQRLKGADRFKDVTGNIAKFAQTQRKKTVLGLGFLLDESNFQNVEQAAKLGQDLRVDYVQFRPVIGLSNYAWVDDALRRISLLDTPVPIYHSVQRFVDLRDHAPRGYEVCRASVFIPCVGADGTLWVCPNMRGLRSLGSLVTDSFEDLWKQRPIQCVGVDCREMCRCHMVNQTLEYVCSKGQHDNFV
jgi:MoaA/NifB/PqqE/SkfB family radical SAM enzyme